MLQAQCLIQLRATSLLNMSHARDILEIPVEVIIMYRPRSLPLTCIITALQNTIWNLDHGKILLTHSALNSDLIKLKRGGKILHTGPSLLHISYHSSSRGPKIINEIFSIFPEFCIHSSHIRGVHHTR